MPIFCVPPKVHLFCSTPQTPPFPLYLGTVILGRHCLGVHCTDVLPQVFCVSGLGSTDTKFGKHLASLPPLTIFLSTKIALKKLPYSSPCLPSLQFFKKREKENGGICSWLSPHSAAQGFILLSPFYRWGFSVLEKLWLSQVHTLSWW